MFEKVTRGRAERRGCFQANGISASMAAHGACALAIAVLSLNAARAGEPEETATFLLLATPQALAETPPPPPERPAEHDDRAALPSRASTPASETPAPRAEPSAADRAPEPGAVAELELRAPDVTLDVLPPSGPAIDVKALRGLGDVAPDAGAEAASGLAGTSADDVEAWGGEFVEGELLARPPRVTNRLQVAEVMSAHYPTRMRFRGVEGEVVVTFIIGTNGRPEMDHVFVVSTTHPDFIAAAMEGLRRMRFRPAELNGERVRVRVSLPLVWVLPG